MIYNCRVFYTNNMEYTVSKMESQTPIISDNKVTGYLTGYAFIDEFNHCIIIVYGENKRDYLIKKLNNVISIN